MAAVFRITPSQPTFPTPPNRFDHWTFDHRTIRRRVLASGFEAEHVEWEERGESGRSEGTVGYVEVLQLDSVGNFIFRATSTPYPATDTFGRVHLEREVPELYPCSHKSTE